MKIKTRLILYAVLVLAYFGYMFVVRLELFKAVEKIDLAGCQVIPAPPGGEDIVVFNDTLIFSGDDRLKMEHPRFQLPNTPDGKLFGLKEGGKEVYEIERVGFPSGTAFHPHGTFLRGSRLFVINHAYSKGGERIDTFNLAAKPDGRIAAHYHESFVFGSNFYGIFNDLVAISEDEYYVTQWLTFAEGDLGKSDSITSQLLFILPSLVNIKSTHIFYCKREHCQQVPSVSGLMFNGLEWDGGSRLFAADTTDKAILELEFSKDDPLNLKLLRRFSVTYAADNVFYDASRNELLVAATGRAIEFLKYKKAALRNPIVRPSGFTYYSGFEVVDLTTGKASTKMMQKDLIYGISTALRYKGKVYFGTWNDDRIVVCPSA